MSLNGANGIHMSIGINKTILCVIGTRPEAIKMAPVILELRKKSFQVRVLATAQHRNLLDQVLDLFTIVPDIDLNIMRPNQSLAPLTARLLLSAEEVLASEKPDAVLVQGDTTTVMAVALACFYQHIPIGHVEAGLRTWDMDNPFPEEANRVITGKLARWHFAPTEESRLNLLRDGISDNNIFITGNTVIDALLSLADKISHYLLILIRINDSFSLLHIVVKILVNPSDLSAKLLKLWPRTTLVLNFSIRCTPIQT